MPRFNVSELGVRAKFTILLLLFGLAPAAALYLILLSNGGGIQQLMMDRVEAAAREIGQTVSYTLNERHNDVQAFAFNPDARDPAQWRVGGPDRPLVQAINAYVTRYRTYPLSVVVDLDGVVVASNTILPDGTPIPTDTIEALDFSRANWFGAVVATGRLGRDDVYVGAPQQVAEIAAIAGGDGFVIPYAAPIRDESGATVGYWINFADFGIVEDAVADLIASLRSESLNSPRVTILDRLGTVILDWDTAIIDDGPYVPDFRRVGAVNLLNQGDPLATLALQGDSGAIIVDGGTNATTAVVGYASGFTGPRAPALDWSVLVRVPFDEALGSWNAILRSMLIAAVIAALVIIIVGFGLGTMFTMPIRKLREVMTTPAADATDLPIPYIERRDELGDMARALTVFREGMRRVGETTAEGRAQKALEAQVVQRTLELARSNAILAERSAWLEGILGSLPIAVGLIDRSGIVLTANHQLLDLIGSPDNDALSFQCYLPDGSVCPPDHRPTARVLRGETLRGEEIEIRREGEPRRFVSVNAAPIRDPEGHITAAVLVFEDVTTKREASERVTHLALYDPLTNLPNRRALLAELNNALARAASRGGDLALLLIDLDDFKTVNDIRGHHIGDEVLVEVAERLQSCVRAGDLIARLGGDEFAFVVVDFPSIEDLSRRADRLLAGLRAQFTATEGIVEIRASVGVAVSPRGTVNAEELFQMGDLALYAAKSVGGGSKRYFHPEMRLRALELSIADADIPRGLRAGEFEAFFQPIVELRNNTVTSVEALLRWRHPDRGLLGPSDFLDHAIRNQQIVPITYHIVTESLRHLAQWRRSGLPSFKMAINLSGAALVDDGLADHIARRLVTEGLKGSDVILEVVEDAINEFDRSIAAIGRLREMGIVIAIDDFGTGHSSLARLRELPIDLIKIDRAFMTRDTRTSAILAAMINLGHSLGIPVVVEGVEEPGHVDILKQANATFAQGYHYARPMPASEFEGWLREQMAAGDANPRRPRLVTL